MTAEEPRDMLVQARGEPSPLYEPEDPRAHEDLGAFTRNVPLDDDRPALPADLADALRSWSLTRPPGGFTSRPDLRKHVKQGLALAQRLARRLGPSWVVRYWDEQHRTAKWVCWGCDRFHWERDSHGTPPHPVDITVEGEFKFGPLRSDGFGDFFPDDPAAALALSDDLVADLYRWAESIDTTLNLHLRDREDGKYDADWQRLFHEGAELAKRVAHELGPDRKVTYKGVANGGLAALTSVTWQGDRQL
ncbi:hypothetical protein [Streptomyces sp. NBC_00620]|uniref:hypothetical protein n=1 Tax=Streptomyces sp. NBC_00620 TaxID=2903666 RepID=UPI00225A114C|nr:hypothetical protein [Streptomyces sp. NBC_00620]MCX4973985.1 hypothetical protein [Streptomyces sp. NBC_00620]